MASSSSPTPSCSSDRPLLRRVRGALLRTVDVLDGVVTGQALEFHQRVAIAEHVRALQLAPIAIGLAVARLALDVVRARAFARTGQPWTADEVSHHTARDEHDDHRGQ